MSGRGMAALEDRSFVLFCFLWVRATFPRFRYDQLMRLGWKVFLPLSLFWLVLTAGRPGGDRLVPGALTRRVDRQGGATMVRPR